MLMTRHHTDLGSVSDWLKIRFISTEFLHSFLTRLKHLCLGTRHNVISRESQWWSRKMSAVSSGYL